ILEVRERANHRAVTLHIGAADADRVRLEASPSVGALRGELHLGEGGRIAEPRQHPTRPVAIPDDREALLERAETNTRDDHALRLAARRVGLADHEELRARLD